MFGKIRKLIVAVVGLGVFILHERLGIDMAGMEGTIVEMVIAGLTAAGVWAVPNDPETE